ncbi:hypothetical protein [Nocardia sp. alder85J]|uniref:hypothetical protein n=1 Tax=Nocardia sp. alder85J TaxID=2862949 RepID=UPI001CD5C8E0|nr:hypothetical protein [Nocardia sp. alder85J]MCX4093048.1 hypothetical protein [Nocardia sp. alder85J]
MSDEQRAAALSRAIARELAAAGPPGWQRLEAVFALTVTAGVAFVDYFDAPDRVVRREPAPEVVEAARGHREIAARLGAGPWWRMLLQLNRSGQLEVDHDYGDEPFPDDQLLTPEAYLLDLRAFPRPRLPIWLAAHIGHAGRQQRTPAAAAAADRASGASAETAPDLPPLGDMWARWSVIAAVFAAIRSPMGPRMLPSLGYFEGAGRSGSTLCLLPGGRAVLSGGIWNDPALDDAYNGSGNMPHYFAGAPDWVANQVLNPRAAAGLLSFCYWWDRHHWRCGDSPAATQLGEAVPGVWTADTTVDLICGLIAPAPTAQQRTAATALVNAAEAGAVTDRHLADLFGAAADVDIPGAAYQLTLAGVTADTEGITTNGR